MNGEAVRRLRRLLAWNQLELGKRAGVSERTVRNAEKSSTLDVAVAGYLAGALSVPLADIVLGGAENASQHNWVRFVGDFDQAYATAITRLDFDSLIELMHPDVQWFCISSASATLCGEFHQLKGLESHCLAVNSWLEAEGFQSRKPTFHQILGEGDLLYLRGSTRFSGPENRSKSYWFAKVIRLDEGKVRFVDHFFGGGANEL